jgi:hypothetical protein
VLLHLAQTNEMAVASVEGRLGAFVDEVAGDIPQTGSIDEWAGALVDLQRSDPGAMRDRWVASAAAQTPRSRAATPRPGCSGWRAIWPPAPSPPPA